MGKNDRNRSLPSLPEKPHVCLASDTLRAPSADLDDT